jgi:hypothetical protein
MIALIPLTIDRDVNHEGTTLARMEHEILQLLRQSPGQRFSFKEVGKLLDRQRFREDANWARHTLQLLHGRKAVEKDPDGRYFVPQEEL